MTRLFSILGLIAADAIYLFLLWEAAQVIRSLA